MTTLTAPAPSAAPPVGLEALPVAAPGSGEPGELSRLRAENDALKARLRDAERLGAVGQLSASVTHEFNNILTTTLNYARLGLRHTEDATCQKAFTRILEAGKRAAKISESLLTFARGGDESRETVRLADLLDDVLTLVGKDLQAHRVRHQTDECGDPRATVSVPQVQQVLVNLILNARQAMPDGGLLTFTLRDDEAGDTAELAVRDTGPGIAREALPRIFEPFYSTKAGPAANGAGGGTGLGLPLCRDVLEAHGGRIRVESALGRGTCFTLKFPRAA